MKLCKECAWYHASDIPPKSATAICQRPTREVDVVTGEPLTLFCSVERNATGACALAAHFFEPRTPETKPHDNPNPLVQDG